jgi:lysophospholipase L1-like esterase
MIIRRNAPWLFALLLSAIPLTASAQTGTEAPATKFVAAPVEPADQAFVKLGKDGQPDKRFMELHEKFLARGKQGQIGLLFLGDSITEGWGRTKDAKDIYDQHYSKYDAANFGIGGDRTQHVLWRIENGELDGINPKVVVLMIGTNNTAANTAEQIAAADTKIVQEIHQKLPDTKVLLLGVFPRGADPELPATAAVREKIKQINAVLAKLDNGGKTRYLDFGDKFLNSEGLIRASMMPDALHPTPKGYKIWAEEMDPLLTEMMK